MVLQRLQCLQSQGQCWVHFQNAERCFSQQSQTSALGTHYKHLCQTSVNKQVNLFTRGAPCGWPRGELCAGRRLPPPLPVFHELQRTRVKNGRNLQPGCKQQTNNKQNRMVFVGCSSAENIRPEES